MAWAVFMRHQSKNIPNRQRSYSSLPPIHPDGGQGCRQQAKRPQSLECLKPSRTRPINLVQGPFAPGGLRAPPLVADESEAGHCFAFCETPV